MGPAVPRRLPAVRSLRDRRDAGRRRHRTAPGHRDVPRHAPPHPDLHAERGHALRGVLRPGTRCRARTRPRWPDCPWSSRYRGLRTAGGGRHRRGGPADPVGAARPNPSSRSPCAGSGARGYACGCGARGTRPVTAQLLFVVLAGAQGGPDGAVSLWGRDPAYTGPTITAGTVPPLVDATQLLLGTVSDQPVERSARPVSTARGVALADVPETPPAVVLGYQPEFHPATRPLVRGHRDGRRARPLAVRPAGARALPAQLDRRVQPLAGRPDVVGTAATDADHDGEPAGREPRPGHRHRRHRPAAGAAGGRGVAGDDLDADTPMGQAARVDALLAGTRIVTARVERRPEGASDLQWETVTYRRLPVVGTGTELTMRVTWSGELAAARTAGAPHPGYPRLGLAGRRRGAGASSTRTTPTSRTSRVRRSSSAGRSTPTPSRSESRGSARAVTGAGLGIRTTIDRTSRRPPSRQSIASPASALAAIILFADLPDFVGGVKGQQDDEAAEDQVGQTRVGPKVTTAITMIARLTSTSLRAERNAARLNEPPW